MITINSLRVDAICEAAGRHLQTLRANPTEENLKMIKEVECRVRYLKRTWNELAFLKLNNLLGLYRIRKIAPKGKIWGRRCSKIQETRALLQELALHTNELDEVDITEKIIPCDYLYNLCEALKPFKIKHLKLQFTADSGLHGHDYCQGCLYLSWYYQPLNLLKIRSLTINFIGYLHYETISSALPYLEELTAISPCFIEVPKYGKESLKVDSICALKS